MAQPCLGMLQMTCCMYGARWLMRLAAAQARGLGSTTMISDWPPSPDARRVHWRSLAPHRCGTGKRSSCSSISFFYVFRMCAGSSVPLVAEKTKQPSSGAKDAKEKMGAGPAWQKLPIISRPPGSTPFGQSVLPISGQDLLRIRAEARYAGICEPNGFTHFIFLTRNASDLKVIVTGVRTSRAMPELISERRAREAALHRP